MDPHIREDNRKTWNAAIFVHHMNITEQADFFCNGGSTLLPEERELLGNIANLDVVHLLCNAGQDTLSLAQLGATVTGVDMSDEAIKLARQLSEAADIPATFYRSDVLEWLVSVHEKPLRFDRAYCSYGAVRWIADLNAWARGIFTVLRDGGRLVIMDFHPIATMFNRDWQRIYPYRVGGEVVTLKSGVGTSIQLSKDAAIPFLYNTGNENFSNPTPGHFFSWGLGEIITALATAGFYIARLNEYHHSRYQHFNDMQETPDRRKVPPPHIPPFPLLFGIVATKGFQNQ